MKHYATILTVTRFFFWHTKIKVKSQLNIERTWDVLKKTGGPASGLHIQVIRPYRIIINSMRHYGRRGTPIIPHFYADLREDPEGVILHGIISLPFPARFFLFLFPAVVTIPILCSWSKIDLRMLGAAALFFSLYIPLLASVFIIGQQDIRYILSTLETRLQSDRHSTQRAKLRKKRAR